jgi:tetratricopeptide (TPR) repeat protein
VKKIFISFFVLFLFGCTPSAQKADIKENALPRGKIAEAKPGEIVQSTTMKAFHMKCFSCHSDPDKGQLYPFIKTKSNRVIPHTRKSFSRIEAICTSCHDFFHYIHPEGVGFKSERVAVPAKIELDNGKINCLSCHNLHQKEPSYKNLIPPIKSKEQLKEFCLKCHRQIKQVQDDVYYTLTELRTLTMKEFNSFLEKSEDNWFFQGPIFVKRFYENMKGEKISDQIQVEESFQIRKYSSLALTAIADGNLSEAIHLLWTIFRKKSDFAQSYTRLADGIAGIGRSDEAKEIYLHSLEIDNTYAPAYFGLGKIMAHQEEYWEAIDYFSKAVRYDPQMREAYLEMGKYYILVKDYSEGIRAYREVINLDPKNLEGYLKLAQLYLSTNNYNNAIRTLTDALFFYPEHFEIHYELGNAYYAKYDLNQAVTSYKKALEIKPNDVESSIRLGRTYEMLEEPAKAIRNYEHAITSDRYSLEGYLQLAHLYRKLKNFSKVKEASRTALQIRPDSVEIRLTLGDAYFQTQDYSQAEQEYKEILSYNPDHKEANFRLGILYHQDGRDEMAVNTLQKLVETKSNQAKVYLLLGECLKNDPDEAIRIYQQGIENCNEKTVLYFNLAYYYWKELERPDQAQEALEKAISGNPNYAKAYFYLGQLMKEENNIPQAIFFLEKATGIDPTRIDAYLLLAELNKEKHYQLAQEKILKQNLVDFKDISAVPNAQ